MRKDRPSAPVAVALILALLPLTGCGDAQPQFGPVEGVLRIKGKPKSGILVRFLPDPAKGNDLPINASAITDADGKYKLKYAHKELEGEGAAVGWHRVILEDSRLASIPQGAPIPPRMIPIAYNTPATTPLAFEVRAEPQTIDLGIP